jgi:hypothetical protein
MTLEWAAGDPFWFKMTPSANPLVVSDTPPPAMDA